MYVALALSGVLIRCWVPGGCAVTGRAMRAYGFAGSPAGHGLLQHLGALVWVKVTDDRQCAMARAEILVVKRTDMVERHDLDAFDLFLNGRDVTYVVFGIR